MNFWKPTSPILLIFCFLFLSAQKCKEGNQNESMNSAEQKALLCKKWNLETSEENGTIKIFRPKGYEMPPRRGQHSYEFKEDGTAFFYTFGPTDRPVTHKGTWEAQEGNKLALSLGEAGNLQFELVELTEDKLAVKTISNGK